MKTEKINKRILKLWAKYSNSKSLKFMPLLYPELKNKTILFVGCNPSMLKKNHEILKYPSDDIQTVIDIEERYKEKFKGEAGNSYSYFNKFKEIAKENNEEWEHIDLFLYRETNQNEFKKIILRGKNFNSFDDLNDFAIDQIEIFKDLLEKLDPMVVVVANAFASDIIKKVFKIEKLPNNDKKGYHEIEISKKKIPIFFSGMLTQQRALDKHSLERLKWHIRRALED